MSNPSENAVDKASRLGLVLVEPKDSELFIDLDSAGDVRFFDERFEKFKKVFPDASVEFTTSVSGHWHAYVDVPGQGWSALERVAMQAALGSDPLREMISVKHLRGAYEYPSVFFEKPGAVKRLIA